MEPIDAEVTNKNSEEILIDVPLESVHYRQKELSRSRALCSLTPKNYWLRRHQLVSDTTRRLVSVSLSPHHSFEASSWVSNTHRKEKCLRRWFAIRIASLNSLPVGFKTPAEAIEGTYVDKKCPFTSDVSIRGRIFK